VRPKKPQGTEQLGRNSCPTWGRSCGKKKEHARTRGHRLFEIGKEHFSQRLNWFSLVFTTHFKLGKRHITLSPVPSEVQFPLKRGTRGFPRWLQLCAGSTRQQPPPLCRASSGCINHSTARSRADRRSMVRHVHMGVCLGGSALPSPHQDDVQQRNAIKTRRSRTRPRDPQNAPRHVAESSHPCHSVYHLQSCDQPWSYEQPARGSHDQPQQAHGPYSQPYVQQQPQGAQSYWPPSGYVQAVPGRSATYSTGQSQLSCAPRGPPVTQERPPYQALTQIHHQPRQAHGYEQYAHQKPQGWHSCWAPSSLANAPGSAPMSGPASVQPTRQGAMLLRQDTPTASMAALAIAASSTRPDSASGHVLAGSAPTWEYTHDDRADQVRTCVDPASGRDPAPAPLVVDVQCLQQPCKTRSSGWYPSS